MLYLMLYTFFLVPPTIRPDPPDGNYVVKKGRKVELKCVASGNPDPTITWTRQVQFMGCPIYELGSLGFFQ